MKKTLVKGLALAFVGSFFVAGSAMALPWDTLSSDYQVSTSMDYWTPTDLTTNITGTSLFQLEVELAGYESNMGLYTIDGTGSVDKTFEVFNMTEEPFLKDTITFWNDSGTFKITDDFDTILTTAWTVFDDVFGFYYGVDSDDDDAVNYTFYTDKSLNTSDAGIEHITTAYNAGDKDVYIYLEDMLTSASPDWDWADMTVYANDVAPIPEPATMLLFGTGLAGLATLRRRKAKK